MAEAAKSASTQALKKLEEQLTCPICLEFYKDPRVLYCFHVYCKDCLERLVVETVTESGGAPGAEQTKSLSLRCPTCRKPTFVSSDGVSGLPPAFHIKHLFELQTALTKSRTTPRNVPLCGKCKKTSRPATSYCRDCGKFVCEMCVDIHVEWKEFSSHKIISMEQLYRVDSKELVPPKGRVLYCDDHEGKEVDLYCTTCEEVICFQCTIEKHKGHQHEVISETFEKHKAEILASLEPLGKNVSAMTNVVQQLKKKSHDLDNQQSVSEDVIRQEIQQLQDVLEARKMKLMKKLNREVKGKLKNLEAQKSELQMTQDKLSNCLSVVKTSLELGTEEEIVSMKSTIVKNVEKMTEEHKRRDLSPCESASLEFTASAELEEAFKLFREVHLEDLLPENCRAEGRGLRAAELGETATVVVYLSGQEGRICISPFYTLNGELSSNITGEKIECSVRRSEVDQYEITYQPTVRGLHQLHITVGDEHIKGSPFNVVVKLPVRQLGTPTKTITYALQQLWDMTVNSHNDLILADNRRHRISIFSAKGENTRSFGMCGHDRGELYCPRDVAVDSADNIVVADGNSCIIKFTPDGEFIDTVGQMGDQPLEFSQPTGIGIHPHTSRIYVADTGNHRIQVFNPDLTLYDTFSGRGNKRLKSPWGVAFDTTGNLYVADTENHCIQVFTAEGKFLRRFGGMGIWNGELNFPTSLCIDIDDIVYVTEQGNHRVSIFTSDGHFLSTFGTFGKGFGQFNEPRGIGIDRNGYIIVNDFKNRCIQYF